jgi:phosphohistidine phosphatase
MRHAKAVPAAPGQPDRDRPLAERGHRDAALIGRSIAEDLPPDLMLCSPALRTMETMTDVAAAFSGTTKSVAVDSLYGGDPAAYLAAVADGGGRAQCLLVIGHNPAIHETAAMLAREPGAKMRAKFPTGAVAILAFDVDDWSAARPRMGKLVRFLRPKDLGAGDADD